MIIPADLDVAALTRDEASKLFEMAAQEIEHSTGCDYELAVARAKILNKALVARMNDKTAPLTAALANSIPPAPVFAPQIKVMLGIGADSDDQECKTAWAAAKGVLSPRDSKSIWKALFALWSGRLRAENSQINDAGIEIKMRERFPLLAAELDHAKRLGV